MEGGNLRTERGREAGRYCSRRRRCRRRRSSFFQSAEHDDVVAAAAAAASFAQEGAIFFTALYDSVATEINAANFLPAQLPRHRCRGAALTATLHTYVHRIFGKKGQPTAASPVCALDGWRRAKGISRERLLANWRPRLTHLR